MDRLPQFICLAGFDFHRFWQMEQRGKREFEMSGIAASVNHQIAQETDAQKGSGGRMCKTAEG